MCYMLQQISYFMIGGLPFIVYLGIIGVVLLVLTVFFVVGVPKKRVMSVTWHRRLALVGMIIVLIHAVLGILLYI